MRRAKLNRRARRMSGRSGKGVSWRRDASPLLLARWLVVGLGASDNRGGRGVIRVALQSSELREGTEYQIC